MIAIDLDNTIIRYDRAFEAAATRLHCLPNSKRIDKAAVKDAAIKIGGNTLWTHLQALAYGEEVSKAELFPGCATFISACREDVVIISHKTRFPAAGDPVDLREAALTFLAATPLAGLPVHFLDSREAKVAKVSALRPRALIDDLPEIFETPGFPQDTAFHLFDPENARPCWTSTPRLQSWHEAAHLLLDS
jgi:hypothetical protein